MKNKKSLGQHWLTDRAVLLDIANLAAGKTNVVVEVGPGLGTLTSALLKFFDEVIAIEFDAELARKLPGSFPGKKLRVINKDILSVDEEDLPEEYTLAGNIPYYITSPIVQKFLAGKNKPKKMVLLMQKEVAERLAADAGDYSILGLSAQIYAKVSLGPVVGRGFFAPPPKVDSQVVVFEPYELPLATESTMALIKIGFSAPRKKLVSNLTAGLQLSREGVLEILSSLEVSGNARPADLTIKDWLALEKKLHKR
ncbi:MAG: 16S rRNA (adenine(1518)-N(6)/adenine(1519)-N(6))-dimethyltransferase RsmA [Candidatus Nomurabacteria bacterium]|jgi:16S rRNA (adenine1518-N6/adenine1519-N6)-dimethyltransferase|nr:16S rRNA (adenine(1518)-N(6)/adenine(1519)-N(6))-dimethyltransferase RsmA [Candidatus Nomurabacteria bacterium]